ncbi:menin-like [Montipora capricornis]|uniref:menin-like n=1 Tax=Montipora capricornis TaxID=246305 RepID=UPI0035F20A8C
MEADCSFPLKDISSVVEVFKAELTKAEPNLAKLSIVLGFFETALTCKGSSNSCPSLDKETYDALVAKFQALIQKNLSANKQQRPATREFITDVADLVWSCLSKSYFKDKPHIQNLYSFLTGNRLDCFGVAFTVVAICQALSYNDVHLALSEDHAWVVFGENGKETAEVTWHGKGNEDKRGRPVDFDESTGHSWLYLSGYPVKCTRHMEVASMVSSINPTISSTSDSAELAGLQQKLLWLLYDQGHLKRYPLGLGNLGDLEEVTPTANRPAAEEILKEGIRVNQSIYKDQHVYPYTYLGGFYYRQKQVMKAMEYWVKGAHVAGKYNYSKEDEEMYKEFYEIANDFIPNILKMTSSSKSENGAVEKGSNLGDNPSFFSLVLQFYDGICLWEEGSHTPVLHADWAKKLVQSLSKFSSSCRSALSSGHMEKLLPRREPLKNDTDGGTLSSASTKIEDNSLIAASVENGKKSLELNLKSEKMRGMRDLLTTGGKINTSAIKLQLTAQSQVSVPKNRRRSSFKTDDYVYDFGEEAEGDDEDDQEDEEERPRKILKGDRDFVVY